jgi:L-seryl-tRNA(Ser) seleniumtransferase
VSVEEQFRQLPSVDELASSLANLEERFPRRLIVDECRRVLERARGRIRAGGKAPAGLALEVRRELEGLARPSLVGVINATGVILHTNLGRAPLALTQHPARYSNLEYDVAAGRRGKRDSHVGPLLERLLGRPAIAVNNCAAAVYLALHELAAGGEVLVSRGELIEIGDGFRIPEIMARSGARLVEVGTTNRTRVEDYRAALTSGTRLILRVHPSNFRVTGFAGRPSLEELAAVAREAGVPLFEDLGSGCLVPLDRHGIDEPTIAVSFKAGADLVSFSGDKLLCGPQAGILAGEGALIQRLRKNPMFRALRLDKLVTAALETTLRHWLLEEWDEIPALRMIRMTPAEVRARAERLVRAWGRAGVRVEDGESLAGGGSTPDQTLATALVVVEGNAAEMERRLRAASPPVIARIADERLLLDLRTVAPEEEPALLEALRQMPDAKP